jgi:hypothetical protein
VRGADDEEGNFSPMATKPEHTRVEVDKAGLALQHWNDSTFDNAPLEIFLGEMQKYEAALEIINNWRSSHSYPLNTFQMNLRRAATAIDADALIAQRIKRLSSISHKLDPSKKCGCRKCKILGAAAPSSQASKTFAPWISITRKKAR